MASVFSGYVQTLLAPAQNDIYGEAMVLLPRLESGDVNAPVQGDTSRSTVSFTGILFDPASKPQITHSYDMHTAQRPGLDTTEPRIDIMPDQIALGITVRRGDLIEQAATGQRWRVSRVVPTKGGVLRCFVNLVSP